MSRTQPQPLDRRLGSILVEGAAELTERWLRELARRLPQDESRIFPSDRLLDHIPEVIQHIGELIASGGDEEDVPEVRRVLRGLAELRREQGYDVDEVIAEFDLLGELLFEEMEHQARAHAQVTRPDEAVAASGRLYKALLGMTRVTAEVFRDAGLDERRARARLLGDFGAALTHELRSRLQAARATVAVLEEGEGLSGEQLGLVTRRLRRSLTSLDDLVAEVRTLSMTEASEEGVLARHRPLSAICRGVVGQLAALADSEGVELSLEDEPPERSVDASRLELVLINLVTNGIRHRDPARPHPWVRIRVTPLDDGWLRVEVRDNGRGVASEDRRRIFEQRERGTTSVDGDGLGLAIARTAIEQIGGEIGVDSTIGEGSTFWFTLPPPGRRS